MCLEGQVHSSVDELFAKSKTCYGLCMFGISSFLHAASFDSDVQTSLPDGYWDIHNVSLSDEWHPNDIKWPLPGLLNLWGICPDVFSDYTSTLSDEILPALVSTLEGISCGIQHFGCWDALAAEYPTFYLEDNSYSFQLHIGWHA